MKHNNALQADDNHVLRGKILAIVAAMCSRMVCSFYENHLIIPVCQCLLSYPSSYIYTYIYIYFFFSFIFFFFSSVFLLLVEAIVFG